MRIFTASLVLVTTHCSILFQTSDLQSKDAADDAPFDAGQAGEASVDAGLGDAGDRWCAALKPAPVFCDDFDDQGPFTRWSNQAVRANGTVTRDTAAFRSSPNALLADTPGSSNPGSALLFLETATTMSKLHFAYDMRIDARDPQTGYAEINYVKLDNGTKSSAIYMRVYKDAQSTTTITAEAYLADGGVPQHDIPLSGNPRFDGWRRVDLDLDLAAHSLKIAIDGASAGSATLEPDLYVASPMRVETGIGYTGSPSGEWKIRYDNVTIDWQP